MQTQPTHAQIYSTTPPAHPRSPTHFLPPLYYPPRSLISFHAPNRPSPPHYSLPLTLLTTLKPILTTPPTHLPAHNQINPSAFNHSPTLSDPSAPLLSHTHPLPCKSIYPLSPLPRHHAHILTHIQIHYLPPLLSHRDITSFFLPTSISTNPHSRPPSPSHPPTLPHTHPSPTTLHSPIHPLSSTVISTPPPKPPTNPHSHPPPTITPTRPPAHNKGHDTLADHTPHDASHDKNP